MPYRIDPNDSTTVQILKGKKWKRLKKHPTAGAAQRHLTALKINVKESYP